VYPRQHTIEAALDAKSRRDRGAAAESVGWVVWQGPGRGYIAFESDMPLIADALEALWSLRAQRHGSGTRPGGGPG
jgi:hypothetical protein